MAAKHHPAHKHVQAMQKQMDSHHAAMTQMMDQLANSLQQGQGQGQPQEGQLAGAAQTPGNVPGATGVSPLGGQAR